MSLIRTGKGNLTSNPKQILQEQHNCYQRLYAKNSNVVFGLKNTKSTTISDDQKKELDKPLTIMELTQTVRTLKQGVSPGIDGLNAEFYQFFWD